MSQYLLETLFIVLCVCHEREYFRLLLHFNHIRVLKFEFSDPCSSLGGNLKPLTLSQNLIGSFLAEIPYAALTQTFRDAIEVAQYFGINYIWIDSLCTIQDDSNDWSIESVKMSDVYGNSHLNIEATSAPDGSHGLFQVGKENRNLSFHTRPFNAGQREVSYHFVPNDMYGQPMLDAPLNKRGWVVQEDCFHNEPYI